MKNGVQLTPKNPLKNEKTTHSRVASLHLCGQLQSCFVAALEPPNVPAIVFFDRNGRHNWLVVYSTTTTTTTTTNMSDLVSQSKL